VLIKCGQGGCTDQDIREAAGIAAFHSKAQSSENVPVDYVPIRYVKKPQGAKPGMVIFTNNRTLYADPIEGRPSK
jgi:predicted ribosome quality control (RQC) complex YloA/Tae2 family protein